MIRIIIADDHDLVRRGISRILQDVDDIAVVGEAKSGEEAVRLAKSRNPHVVFMDVRMPGIGGLEATKKILAHNASIGIIAVSGYNDGSYPGKFVRAGALGYISKDTPYPEMVDAIRQVAAGEVYLSPEVAQRIATAHKDNNPFDALSERELQIAMMIVECFSTTDIADKLHLSPKTVSSYKNRVFDKLQVQGDVELTLLALQHKMIEASTPAGGNGAEPNLIRDPAATTDYQTPDDRISAADNDKPLNPEQ